MSTSTITVPSDYDEAHEAGWRYHRNGVSGCGFYAKVVDEALCVAWCVMTPTADDWDESYPVAATIPLAVLRGIARMPAVGEVRKYEGLRWEGLGRHVIDVADGDQTLYAFDFNDGDLSGRILVVAHPAEDDYERAAAFALHEVIDGDATRTLRGDTLYDIARELVGAF